MEKLPIIRVAVAAITVIRTVQGASGGEIVAGVIAIVFMHVFAYAFEKTIKR